MDNFGPGPWRRIVLAAVAVAAVAAGAAVLLQLDDDDEPTPADSGSGPGEVSLPDDDSASELTALGDELVALLAGRADLTYHASYEADGGEEALGGTVAVEEFRAGSDRLRSDTRTDGLEGASETRTIVVGGQTVACARTDDEPFACVLEAGAAADPFLGSLREQLAGVAVEETATTAVGGRAARCFTFVAEDAPRELCLDERGIPLRIAVGDLVLTLTSLEDDVPDDAFDPPAEPVPAEPVLDDPPVDETSADG